MCRHFRFEFHVDMWISLLFLIIVVQTMIINFLVNRSISQFVVLPFLKLSALYDHLQNKWLSMYGSTRTAPRIAFKNKHLEKDTRFQFTDQEDPSGHFYSLSKEKTKVREVL